MVVWKEVRDVRKRSDYWRQFIGGACGVLLLSLTLLAPVIGCGGKCHIDVQPILEETARVLASPHFQKNMEAGTLQCGMPFLLAEGLFANCSKAHPVPVASVGSRQELREVEGLGRAYHDPGIKVYFIEYNTDRGKVAIWYKKPDFYRMGVRAFDKLVVFPDDTLVIACLYAPDELGTRDSLIGFSEDSIFYAEIHHVDDPVRTVSYWYSLVAWDPTWFHLEPEDYRFYPIEAIEVDGEPVDSFQWR
jgi:hypothetical protein